MKSCSHGFDYFFVVRPVLLYPVWIFYLTGLWSGSKFYPFTDWALLSASQWVTFLALTFIMSAVYILNQIQDIETDRINGRLFLLATGHISVKEAYFESFLFISAGLGMAFLLDFRIAFLMLILLLTAGILYNYSPFQWKNKPILGLLTNGIGGVLIFCIGWVCESELMVHPLQILLFGFAGMAVTLNTTLPDVDGDRKNGKITFAVKYGIRLTSVWAFIFETGTVVIAYIAKEWLLFFPAAAVFPFFLWALMKGDLNSVLRATRISVLAFAIAVFVVYPWFLMFAFIVFYSTRLYYAKKFDFVYPSFSIKKDVNS